jgi:cysteinyl-tRNA synthetase
MALKMYETLTRSLQEVRPMDGETLRFYCCGPTVYGPAHIGNFRTFTVQDTFRRVLEIGGLKTKHVRNLTDVDDKTIRVSQEQGKTLEDFTVGWTNYFHEDCRALNLLTPHVEPTATGHIAEQIEMIESLIAKGHAYAAADGSVYFKIASFANYGRLSHLDTRELQIGAAAVDSDEYEKEGLADFVLWKGRKPADGPNFWPSPWGEGRPGWHLECSAMTRAYLGDTFDLHSGGVDLIFPHHENEIAQSECCTGHTFSRLWLHVNHLQVDGAKMAKSLGNMYTIRDLIDKGHTAMRVRFVILSGHYRTPMNFVLANLDAARQALEKISKLGHPDAPKYEQLLTVANRGLFQPAFEALEDDLNTPEALGRIFAAINRTKPASLSQTELETAYLGLHSVLAALGLDLAAERDASKQPETELPAEVISLAELRWAARTAKNWAESDRLRGEIDALGFIMKDGKEGYELLPK